MTRLFLVLLLLSLASAVHGQEAEVVFTIPEVDLILEGITFDSTSGSFFVSSIFREKILRIQPRAEGPIISDFIDPGQDGFMAGVGMDVDEERGLLYALSGVLSQGPNYASGLFQYDLSGTLIFKIVVQDTAATLWNDVVVTRDGMVYFTDTMASNVRRFNPENRLLTVFAEGVEYPNGLVLSPDDQTLYVATYRQGIQRIDLSSGGVQSAHAEGTDINGNGIDGLMLYVDPTSGEQSLFGIQNAYKDLSKHAITRYRLNDAGMIVGAEILDQDNEHFSVPTTGVIAGNRLYCIANSQLDFLDQENLQLIDADKLQPSIILDYNLQP